jgi:hypothetical protein
MKMVMDKNPRTIRTSLKRWNLSLTSPSIANEEQALTTGQQKRVGREIYNGKRIARNIYADSEEACEIKLEALIKEMKA